MEARVITRIEPTRRTHGLTPIRIPELRKVAGYARVSTESEEQENSYEAQVRYFTTTKPNMSLRPQKPISPQESQTAPCRRSAAAP